MRKIKKGVLLLVAFMTFMPTMSALAAGVPAITASREYAFLKDVEAKVIEKTNAKRKENGKSQLTPNALLTRSAEYKSLYPLQYLKADGSVYNEHAFATGPAKVIDENETDPAKIEQAGIQSRDMFGLVDGENMAYTTGYAEGDAERLAEALVTSWMNSAAHKAAILDGSWVSIGVGVSITEKGIMCIQHFSKSNPTSGDAVPNPMVSNQSDANGWLKRTNGRWSYARDGELVYGWMKLGNRWYYLENNGLMKTGWLELDGKGYYFNADGIMQTGWLESGQFWYYLNEDGSRQHGLFKIGKKQYYTDYTTGLLKTGWHTNSSGQWSYYKPGSGEMLHGWIYDNKRWYYVGSNGFMRTGWEKVGGKWYYLSGSGAMAKNWARLNGVWYYLGTDGAMRVGWQKVGGTWYYFRSSGAMAVGWIQIGGKWYYLESSGAMKTGWLKEGNRWYYLRPVSGVMATGKLTIGGKVNNFSSSGVWLG